MLDHLLWVAREVGMYDGEEADPWSVAGDASTSALDALRAYRWVTITDEVILSLTVLGSLAILGSMFLLEYKGRPATTRMRIVQSLVLSDLILGLVGVVGTSIVLGGTPLEHGSTNCNGLGFSLTMVLWTEHLWTLILAIATYMILIYPLHPATLWLERRWYFLWILVWVLAAAIGVIGYTLYGYYPNGGICYYGPNSGLYGELIQFLPRACVMLIISILYARLFVFLRRPDRIRASFSDGSHTGQAVSTRPRAGSCHLFRSTAISGILNRGRTGSKQTDSSDAPINEKGINLEPHNAARSRSASRTREGELFPEPDTPGGLPLRTPPSTPDEPAPWEQVQLPIFHIDGERFGGREAGGGPSSGGLHRETSSIWSGWMGIGKADSQKARRPRPSTASSTSPPMASRSAMDSGSSSVDFYPASPKSATAVAVFPPTAEVESPPLDPDADPDATPTQQRYNAGDIWQNAIDERQGSITSSLTGRVERFRKPSAISSFSCHVSEEPENSIIHSSRQPSARPDQQAHSPGAPTPEIHLTSEKEETVGFPFGRPSRSAGVARSPGVFRREMDLEEGDDDDEDRWDLMRMLQGTGPGGAVGAQQEGEQVELVEESMASYLNRKTALLMLWFPLGYVLLFSVSLIRIIYDFAGQPPIELRALSRWFIFSQGILDALIYGLVEWHTKRVVRKRVRKGTFNTPSASRHGAGNGSAIGDTMRAMGQGSKNLFQSRGSQQAGVNAVTRGATDSQMGRLNGQTMSWTFNRTPTTSTIPPIPEGRTIEQELEDEKEYEEGAKRAGSGSGYELEEDSTRKGSAGSELGKGSEPASVSIAEDGRGRERRKGD